MLIFVQRCTALLPHVSACLLRMSCFAKVVILGGSQPATYSTPQSPTHAAAREVSLAEARAIIAGLDSPYLASSPYHPRIFLGVKSQGPAKIAAAALVHARHREQARAHRLGARPARDPPMTTMPGEPEPYMGLSSEVCPSTVYPESPMAAQRPSPRHLCACHSQKNLRERKCQRSDNLRHLRARGTAPLQRLPHPTRTARKIRTRSWALPCI